jgi:hypothetical protein
MYLLKLKYVNGRIVKPKLFIFKTEFRTGKMSLPGLKSIEEHKTINNIYLYIIIDLLKDIIPNIQINHT